MQKWVVRTPNLVLSFHNHLRLENVPSLHTMLSLLSCFISLQFPPAMSCCPRTPTCWWCHCKSPPCCMPFHQTGLHQKCLFPVWFPAVFRLQHPVELNLIVHINSPHMRLGSRLQVALEPLAPLLNKLIITVATQHNNTACDEKSGWWSLGDTLPPLCFLDAPSNPPIFDKLLLDSCSGVIWSNVNLT